MITMKTTKTMTTMTTMTNSRHFVRTTTLWLMISAASAVLAVSACVVAFAPMSPMSPMSFPPLANSNARTTTLRSHRSRRSPRFRRSTLSMSSSIETKDADQSQSQSPSQPPSQSPSQSSLQLLDRASECAHSETCSLERAEEYLAQLLSLRDQQHQQHQQHQPQEMEGGGGGGGGALEVLEVSLEATEAPSLERVVEELKAKIGLVELEEGHANSRANSLAEGNGNNHNYGHANGHTNAHATSSPTVSFLSTLDQPPSRPDREWNQQQQRQSHQPQDQSRQLRQQESYVLTLEQIRPIFTFTKDKDKNNESKLKVLNLHGLYSLFIIVLTMPFWILAMEITHFLGDAIDTWDPHRAKFDACGKVWCKVFLSMTGSYPEIDGDVTSIRNYVTGQNEEQGSDTGGKACLFVANHASFLDIAVLCTVLDPVFKFIAKDSLKDFPGVGRQLVGGEHVLIDRTDKRSQLRTFKQAIQYLKEGVPIMAFPEGRRSPDGRLMEFKGGLFSMAIKAKVPIIPLSISHTHAIMPSIGFLPVQPGGGKLRVFVHEPIEVEVEDEGDGKGRKKRVRSEEELVTLVREKLLSELPLDQHPLDEGAAEDL